MATVALNFCNNDGFGYESSYLASRKQACVKRRRDEEDSDDHRRISVLRTMDQYESIDVIGRGSYGIVHRARDKRTGEIVAIKQEFNGMTKSSLREIFTYEALHIRHPSIVEFKQVAVDEDNCNDVFIVMEYMENDLKSYIRLFREENHFYNQGDVIISHVKCFMEQLFDGVKFLHENNVMHRDLKPSNILMNRNGLLKICDFGVSRFHEKESWGNSYTPDVGTLWYKSPEILLGSTDYSGAVDMWSLGCIMAELLTGEVLFKGQTEFEHIKSIYRILGTPNEDVWPGFLSLPGSRATFVQQPCNLLRDKFPMLTEAGFDLLNGLLCYDPEKRITAEDALNHAWFEED